MNYKYQHREEEAEYIHQMAYLLNRAADFGAAKDIHIFGLRFWLEELYSKTAREFTAFHRKAEKCLYLGWNCRFDFYFSAQWSGLRIFNLFGIIIVILKFVYLKFITRIIVFYRKL